MKNKMVVRSGIIAIRFNEKPFFSTILRFNPYWDYKLYNEYISQKIVNLSSTKRIPFNCDVIYGSILSGLKTVNTFQFLFGQTSGLKSVFPF